MIALGAVTALGMAIVSVGAPRGAAAVEQAPDNVQQLALVNREKTPGLGDRRPDQRS